MVQALCTTRNIVDIGSDTVHCSNMWNVIETKWAVLRSQSVLRWEV